MSQRAKEEFMNEFNNSCHLVKRKNRKDGQFVYRRICILPPSKSMAKRVPKAKPGVADRFFSSQKKWSRFYNRNKGIRCAGGGPPSGGAAGAPQSP